MSDNSASTAQALISVDTVTQATTETPISVVPPRSPQAYYQQLAAVPIETVARELLAAHITSEGRGEILCNCPHHDSSSKKSLAITPAKQAWFCFGCGVGGGVLQLVEFVQSGKITTKLDNDANGRRPESHRQARDWLAPHAGLPPLRSYGLSSSQLSDLEQNHFRDSRSLDCLTACARWYHEKLMSNQEVLSWWLNKTKLSLDTITEQQIGYADSFGLPAHLRELGFTDDEILSTGLLPKNHQGVFAWPTFRGKITVPYWTCGRVHYMIARESPWTDKEDTKGPKYQKLPTYNEQTRKYVSRAIANNRLHNEDILSTELPYVVITEGITDNLSGIEHGFPCVSPVTVTVRTADWPRLIPKFSKVKTVYLIGDNEVSKAGLEGSLKVAAVLKKNKIVPRIVILPLRDDQRQAREIIAEQWGITDHLDKAEITRKKAEIPDDELDEYKRLTDLAKVDLNAYFADGHTAADLQALLDSAPTPTEFAIDRINVEDPNLENEIKPILRGIAEHDILDTDALINQVRDKIGLKIPKKVLQDQVKAYRKEQKSTIRVATRQSTATVTAPDGTLKNLIQKHRATALQNRQNIDLDKLGEEMWTWFKEHGAVAIRDRLDKVSLHYDRKLYFPNSSNRDAVMIWRALFFDLSGLIQKRTEDAQIAEAFVYRMVKDAIPIVDDTSWMRSDVENFSVFFNLNNSEGEIVKITPEGVEILSNGNNTDKILLQTTHHVLPIHYESGISETEGLALIQHFIAPWPCSPQDKHLILLWVMSFMLIDFSSTKPLVRFEGYSGSGKSKTAGALSVLLFGREMLQKMTIAAAWAQSRISPLIIQDNVEAENQSTSLKDFLLMVATGAMNTKRQLGTDSDTVDEQPHCLAMSNGISPLNAESPEVTNRTFVFDFDPALKDPEYIESDYFSWILKHRDKIISFIIDRTARVLHRMSTGAQREMKRLIVKRFPSHNKERSNEYIALMCLMDDPKTDTTSPSATIHPDIATWLGGQHEAAMAVSAEESPVVRGIQMLFDRYQNLRTTNDAEREIFCQRYLVNFSANGDQLIRIPSTTLYNALRMIYRDNGQKFEESSPSTFGKRIKMDAATIERAGFKIAYVKDSKGRSAYTITEVGLCNLPDAPF